MVQSIPCLEPSSYQGEPSEETPSARETPNQKRNTKGRRSVQRNRIGKIQDRKETPSTREALDSREETDAIKDSSSKRETYGPLYKRSCRVQGRRPGHREALGTSTRVTPDTTSGTIDTRQTFVTT